MRTMIKDNVIRNVPDGMVAKRTAEGYKFMDEPSQVPQNASETVQPQNDTNGAVKAVPEGTEEPQEGTGEVQQEKKYDWQELSSEKEKKAALSKLKVEELREIAKEMKIQGYNNMNKDTLVATILNH